MEDFRAFRRKVVSFEGMQALCLVGPNSSGKTSVLEALRFALLRWHGGNRLDGGTRSLAGAIRRAQPPCRSTRVTARFDAGALGQVALRREVRVVRPEEVDDDEEEQGEADEPATALCTSSYWIAASGSSHRFRRVSEEDYREWVSGALGWAEGDVILPQFSLFGSCSAQRLLDQLPAVLEQAGSSSGSAPLLKRRARLGPTGRPETAGADELPKGSQRGAALAPEAWAARRIDEIYRELSREPLDEHMEEWGEGGQACLRRLESGAFGLLVSEVRGVAACGYGTPLGSLSEADKDLCAIALVLTMQGLRCGLSDAPPPFVALDEPDSRLDKRHAKALLRFLSGPLGPKQCLLLSLDNHSAFDGVVQVNGPENTAG